MMGPKVLSAKGVWRLNSNFPIFEVFPYYLYHLSDKDEGDQSMNLHFTFSIREISEVRDSEQVLKIPMYFTVAWQVGILWWRNMIYLVSRRSGWLLMRIIIVGMMTLQDHKMRILRRQRSGIKIYLD